MSDIGAAVVGLLVLAAAGFLPVLVLVGGRLVALPLFPLAGAAIGALAAASCIATFGTLLMWFVVWSVIAAIISLVVLIGRPDRLRGIGRHLRRELTPMPVAGFVVVVAAAAWALRTLRVHNIGFDTRAIWMLHASWLLGGHSLAYSDIRNHFFVVSHPTYPPLVSAAMALSWITSGNSDQRVAVVTIALLNGCALVVAGWGVVEAARRALLRTQGGSVRRQRVLFGLGVLLGALAIMVAGGVLGTFATNGYADPIWSLAAVSVVVYGLMLESTPSDLGVVAVLIPVCAYAKVEGMAMAIILLVLVAVRRRYRPGHLPLTSFWQFVLRIGVGVVVLLGWEFLTLLIGVPNDPSITGARDGSLEQRAARTWDAAVPHLHVVVLALVCALCGWVLLNALRRRMGIGNDLWAWVALALSIAVLGGAYVFGSGNVELWLATSVNRTTIFVALLAWWMVAVWALCGTAAVLE